VSVPLRHTGRVDSHALAVLEFPAILERLAAVAATPVGAAEARAAAPSGDPQEVAHRQALTAEAIALVEASSAPELGGVEDVREGAQLAARDGVLDAARLRRIEIAIRVGLEARRVLADEADLAPLLHELAQRIDPALGAVADPIGRAVEEDGSDLRDNASRELRRLRTELRNGRSRIAEELARVARSADVADALQERFVTERSGRPVLALRATARAKVPGIVHDVSGSGQTLFVEPFAVVELNNRLAEAAAAEREETERILRELSALAGTHAHALVELVESVAGLDLALARGILSRRWRGSAVAVADDVLLLGARHPLLDEGSAVPIDLDLRGLRALVVSGPNTGGKTVALKTLGLAALLHQTGLRPPAQTATLPVFDQVLADIGDEQSIEMSLSTFSGHLRNVVSILGAATDRSLVLLDEVAAGTDPVEGSALAQALVARLTRQARLTAVTTHYPELKEWASSTSAVVNAATGFDPQTQEPLYRIALGRPGTSHALATAERLGLDRAVVADARARVAPERLRTAELLAEAEAAERAAAGARAAAEQERVEAARATSLARAREADLAAEIERVQAGAARERELAVERAERELVEARAELDAMRAEISAARRQERDRRSVASRAVGDAEGERDRRLGAASERAGRADRALRAVRPLETVAPLAAGDPVEAPDLGVRGTIAGIRGDTAEVIGSGGLRVQIPLARLRPGERREARDAESSVRVVASARGDVSDELDVRGQRAQEAREQVRAFVDAAALAGLPSVRVIHGRGTGAVRAAVRDELHAHRLVERQEPEAQDGATLAHLV
jgi:DNA mismatch repair protein MutS2